VEEVWHGGMYLATQTRKQYRENSLCMKSDTLIPGRWGIPLDLCEQHLVHACSRLLPEPAE